MSVMSLSLSDTVNNVSNTLSLSRTRIVVRHCCQGDDARQWRNPKFDPSPRPKPISDSHKSCRGAYVVDPYTCAKVRYDPLSGFSSAHT